MSTASTALRERSPRGGSSAPGNDVDLREAHTDVTLQDLLDRLGGIAADRVRLHPAPGTATEQDLLDPRQRELRPRRLELIDGTLVEKALMGFGESLLATVLASLILSYLRTNNIGTVCCGGDGYIRLGPGQIRIPDVSFVRWEQLTEKKRREPCPELIADLVVEVLSKGNTKKEIDRKRQEFFARQTKLFWVVDPRKHTVTVYRPQTASQVFGIEDVLDGQDVLPGFRLNIREWFQLAADGTIPPKQKTPRKADDLK